MDYESSSLILYPLYSTKAEQCQDQRQTTVKEKKYGSLTGCPTYTDNLMIIRNAYSGKTNPAKFCNHLDQSKNPFKKVNAPGSTKEDLRNNSNVMDVPIKNI